MRHEDDFIEDWRTVRVDNSRPPLRWIANLAGSIASKSLLNLFYLEDDNKTNTLTYKYYGFIWDMLWPIYQKYGTFYEIKFEEEEYL